MSGWEASNLKIPERDGTTYILIQEECSREQRPLMAQSSAAVALRSRLNVGQAESSIMIRA